MGQVSTRQDPNDNLINYVYDDLGRNIIKVTGSTTLKNVYQFRSFGPSRQEEQRNGLNYMTVYNDYNFYGSQKYKATVYDGVATVVRHEYDDQNRLKNVADAFDYFTQYTFDKTRISKVQTNGSYQLSTADNANAQYTYEPDGKLKSVIYPKLSDSSILSSDYKYDAIGRLLKVTNKKGATALSAYQYGYDANGNITSVTDTTGTTNYQYDKLNRLIQVKRPSGQTMDYTYDVRGNRKIFTADDNLIEHSREQMYTFNVWDQLKMVTEGKVTTEFEYEMQGLRLTKTKTTTVSSSGTSSSTNPTFVTEKVRYSYNNSGLITSEANASNQAIANYVWGPDRLLAKRDVETNKKYYYLYNGHGDVVQIIDEYGSTINNYQYDEWGNILHQEEGIQNAFKYAGEMQDEETGLYYLRARYYDPVIGRFISRDTYEGDITNPLSLNLYTYVENNPALNVDPSGNYCVSKDGKYGHMGQCNDPKNIDNYVPDFVIYNGMPIVNNGIATAYYDQASEKVVQLAKSEQYKWSWNEKKNSDYYFDLITATPPLGSPYASSGILPGLIRFVANSSPPIKTTTPAINGAVNAFQWTGKNFNQMGKNMSPNEMVKNLGNSGWNKTFEPGGKKSGPATILTDPSTGTKVRIHAEPGEGTPYFRVQNKGGGYLDNSGVFPSNASKQEFRDMTHFYFKK